MTEWWTVFEEIIYLLDWECGFLPTTPNELLLAREFALQQCKFAHVKLNVSMTGLLPISMLAFLA